jgi:hypothetical protein
MNLQEHRNKVYPKVSTVKDQVLTEPVYIFFKEYFSRKNI